MPKPVTWPPEWATKSEEDVRDWHAGATPEEREFMLNFERFTFNRPAIVAVLADAEEAPDGNS